MYWRVRMVVFLGWTLLSVCLLVSASQDQKNITAESGQNVTLTCRASNNIQTMEWSRADLGEKYVFLYRDGRETTVHQHRSFKGRVALQDKQMKDGNMSVILKNVMISDSGTYECRVKANKKKRRKRANLKTDPICSIYLRVVDPPGQTGGPKKDEPVGLIAGLLVSGVLIVAAFAGFVIYRKHKGEKSQGSH